MYKIDKNIPLPQRRVRGESEFIKTLRKLKVGESIHSPASLSLRDQYEVYREHKINPSVRYTSRKQEDGSRRFWRVS